MAVFRLLPSDPHSFFAPVSGRVGKITHFGHALYPVAPIGTSNSGVCYVSLLHADCSADIVALQSDTDILSENKRTVIELWSSDFGTVAMVAIGSTMVGSIKILHATGQEVRSAALFGY